MTDATMLTDSPAVISDPVLDSSKLSEPGSSYGIRHILVCLDGSAASTAAAVSVANALWLADIFDARVTLLHVMQHHNDAFGPHTTNALGWEISRQEASARLEQLEREAVRPSGRRIAIRLEQGKPAERISALSWELDADLVVLGSRLRGDHPSWMPGTTAQQVLKAARSSVLITRGLGTPPRFVPPKRILVPLDGSPRTESVLPTVESIAKANGAQLLLAHIVTEPLPTGILSTPEDLQLARELAERLEVQANRYLESLRRHLGCEDSHIETLVEFQPDKRQSLVELASRKEADLIVLSAHGSTCSRGRPFGSVTAHLLTGSSVPLLVLQDLPWSERQSMGIFHSQGALALRGAHSPEGV